MEDILVPLGFFAMVVAIVYIQADRKIKLNLIQHGADARTLKMSKTTDGSLRFGLLLIGVAVGVLMGHLLVNNTNMMQEVAYFSMTFLFGGIALLISALLQKRKTDTRETDLQNERSKY
jgi:predicted MFS family arabinose efflux permease